MEQKKIREQLQALVNGALSPKKGIQNAVMGVSYRDGFHWSGAAGQADPITGSPMTPETPFLIASITKMYTAAAVIILQSRGKLSLDDKISRFIPSSVIQGLHSYKGTDYTASLTIRHLITQTSGLPDYFLDKPKTGQTVFDRLLTEGDRAWHLEDVIAVTRSQFPALFPPADFENAAAARGKIKAHYSDTNYKLLGRIIETAAEKPLADVFQELFFDPFDLQQTYLFGFPRSADPQKPAQVFYKERPIDLDILMSSHGPEGGIVSTISDLLRFGKAYFTGALFEKHASAPPEQRWNPIFFPFQYGCGLMRFKLPRLLMPFGYSPELVGHSGSSGTFLYYDSQLDLYMAGAINQMNERNVPFQLMIKAAQLLKKSVL